MDRAFDRFQAGQGDQVGAVQLTVQRDRQEYGALVVGQVPDPQAEDVGHLGGEAQRLPGLGDAALEQRPADLEDEERVAARLFVHQPQHPRAQREGQVVPEQPRGRLDAEWPWLDLAQVAPGERRLERGPTEAGTPGEQELDRRLGPTGERRRSRPGANRGRPTGRRPRTRTTLVVRSEFGQQVVDAGLDELGVDRPG